MFQKLRIYTSLIIDSKEETSNLSGGSAKNRMGCNRVQWEEKLVEMFSPNNQTYTSSFLFNPK